VRRLRKKSQNAWAVATLDPDAAPVTNATWPEKS
jgi:hypothetical protein